MTALTTQMKNEALAILAAKDRTDTDMWHNGNGHNMTRGYSTYVLRPYMEDPRPACTEPRTINLRARQNMETGRVSFQFTAGIEILTTAQAEQMLRDYNA